jgi:hypothetical protein
MARAQFPWRNRRRISAKKVEYDLQGGELTHPQTFFAAGGEPNAKGRSLAGAVLIALYVA